MSPSKATRRKHYRTRKEVLFQRMSVVLRVLSATCTKKKIIMLRTKNGAMSLVQINEVVGIIFKSSIPNTPFLP